MQRFNSFLERLNINQTNGDSDDSSGDADEENKVDDLKFITNDGDDDDSQELHQMVVQYMQSKHDSVDDLYGAHIITWIQQSLRRDQVNQPPSKHTLSTAMTQTLQLYLRSSLPIFTATYHKYVVQMLHVYTHAHPQSSLFSVASMLNDDGGDDRTDRLNALQTLDAVSACTVQFMHALYDIMQRTDIRPLQLCSASHLVSELLSAIVMLTHIHNGDTDRHRVLWTDINLSLRLFTAFCHHSPSDIISALSRDNNGTRNPTGWHTLLQFVTSALQNTEQEPKLWMLAQRLLRLVRILIEFDAHSMCQVFIQHSLMCHLRDMIRTLVECRDESRPAQNHEMCHLIHSRVDDVMAVCVALLSRHRHEALSRTLFAVCEELELFVMLRDYLMATSSSIANNDADSRTLSLQDWTQTFQLLIACGVAMAPCTEDRTRGSLSMGGGGDEKQMERIWQSLRRHLAVGDGTEYTDQACDSRLRLRITLPSIVTQHIMHMLQQQCQSNHQMRAIVIQHVRALLLMHAHNCVLLLQSQCLSQLFFSVSVDAHASQRKHSYQHLYPLLDACLAHCVQSTEHSELFALLQSFMRRLHATIFSADNAHVILDYLQFWATLITAHASFRDLAAKFELPSHLMHLVQHSDVALISDLKLDICEHRVQCQCNEMSICPDAAQMQSILTFVSCLLQQHRTNCLQFGLRGVHILLSRLRTETHHQHILDAVSMALATLHDDEQTTANDAGDTHVYESQFAYLCHGVCILLNALLLHRDVSVLSKVFILQYVRRTGARYTQVNYSLYLLDVQHTLLQCLQCEYTAPSLPASETYDADADGDVDRHRHGVQLLYLQECVLTMLSLSRREPGIADALKTSSFVEQFERHIIGLCEDEARQAHCFSQFLLQLSTSMMGSKLLVWNRKTLSFDKEF